MPEAGPRVSAERAAIGRRKAPRRSLRARMRANFELAVILSLGLISATVVAAFAVFRFHTGNVTGGVLNCLIVAALVGVMVYANTASNLRRAGILFALVTGLACISSVLVFGRTGLFWGFLAMWIHFAVAPRPLALAINLSLIGVVASQPDLFGEGTERIAYLVTALLVSACAWVVSARLDQQRRQLRLLANVDPLTGAPNRRQLSADLDAMTEPADARAGGVLAVLDLDHFKRVNDRFGHEAGDRVLVALVELLDAGLREGDGLYRLGGEEFVLLLPQARLDEASQRLQMLRAALTRGLSSLPGAVTVSMGAAELEPGEDPAHWLARADAALYSAKQAGRNCLFPADRAGKPAHLAAEPQAIG